MREISLQAKTRDKKGTQAVKKLRRNGMIPAVIYGADEKAIPLEVEEKTFLKLLRSGASESVILTLKIDDDSSKGKKVLIREIQHDPVWGKILHIDFQHISMEKKITLSIPVHLVGAAAGVEEGGIIQHNIRELEIECLPGDIPERVEVNVSNLKIGDAVHVKNIHLDKATILTDLEGSVVSVVPPSVYKEPEVKVAEEEAAEPEVVGEEKPEEGK
ncbi:MAG: 50S ribosomal protein L25/general stress protein Ctc, partial [Candidatus Zixiibacteriota bacterium]